MNKNDKIVKCTNIISKFKKPIISVTGSCGKTTTCKMIHDLLKNNYKINKTHENSNSFLGIPWCVKTFFKNTADIWLFELGIGKVNDMDKLIKMVNPTIRIITNIYNVHVNKLFSLKEYENEKLKMFDSIRENNVAIINNDDLVLSKYISTHIFPPSVKVIYCGSKNTDDVQFIEYTLNNDNVSSKITIRINKNNSLLTFNLDGINKHNAINCCLAVACAIHFNIPINTIKRTLNKFKLYKNRGLITQMPKYILYDYTYNGATYAYMRNLSNFKNVNSKNKLIILGMNTNNSNINSVNKIIIPIIKLSLTITKKIFVYTRQEVIENKDIIDKNVLFMNSFDIIINEIRLLLRSSNEKLYIYMQGGNDLKMFDFVDKIINIKL
jgi:UDP-N-acetylmuramoyl-tripeptide--D-alanyl-D-alanine ligase